MARKLALQWVIAAVNPAVGSVAKAVQDRMRKVMRANSQTGGLKYPIGDTFRAQRELSKARESGETSDDDITPGDGQRVQSGVLGVMQGLKSLTHGLKATKAQLGIVSGSPGKAGEAVGGGTRSSFSPEPARSQEPRVPSKRMYGDADKLGARLSYIEAGIKLVGTYRSDQTPEEKAEKYAESVGGLIGSRMGGAIGARGRGPVGRAVGEMLGGIAGESLAPDLAKRWWLGKDVSEVAVGRGSESESFAHPPGALVRADSVNSPVPGLMPRLTSLVPLMPGAVPMAGPQSNPPAESLSGWMARHWFAPREEHRAPAVEDCTCTPCPCEVGKTVRDTAPSDQPRAGGDYESALMVGSVALARVLTGPRDLPGRVKLGEVLRSVRTGVVGKVKRVFDTLAARRKGAGGAKGDPQSLPESSPPPSSPGIAGRMWAGLRSVARLSLLEAGIKALTTAGTAETREQKAEGYGGAVGGLGGALIGGALGSVVPVIGTAAGALFGGMLGDHFGSLLARRWFASDADTQSSTQKSGQEKPLVLKPVPLERSQLSGAGPAMAVDGMPGRAVRAITSSAAEPELLAKLPRTEQQFVAQQPQINQQFTFAPNIPFTIQGSLSDPLQFAREVEAIVRRQFDELIRQATSRQLYDVPHVA